jgi:sugar lactone lactonase YvrE
MTEPQVLMSGLGLVESPRWHHGQLWFADWIAGEIIALDVEDDRAGRSEVVVRHPSLPLCFDRLADGTPVIVSGPEKALLRVGDDGTLTRYADLAPLSEYGCNDIVVDGRGNAYVNNGNFDFAVGPPAGDVAPGFVALVTPDGHARRVAEDIAFPNGMAVLADGTTLIVADSYRHALIAFDIEADGSLANRRTWADLVDGTPDGICADAENAVWYADVPNQRCVRVHEGGEVRQTVDLDRGAFACMLGGSDGATLFIVAAQWPGVAGLGGDAPWNGQVLSTRVSAPGAGWPTRS